MTEMRNVVYIVGAALLTTIVGIIVLALFDPDPIPDVLQNLAIGSLTGLVGLLAPSPIRQRAEPHTSAWRGRQRIGCGNRP